MPAAITRQLLCHVLNKNSAWLFGHDDVQLTTQQIRQLDSYQKQFLDGMPLAYVIGKQPFWDLTLTVNQHTLIPRPDTELIIETIESMALNPRYILDLGTGSGALALVLARLYPNSRVLATDISESALQVAADNARRYQVSNVEYRLSHWFAAIDEKNFDLIVSNPPYIDPYDQHLKDLTHEPQHALVSDEKGLSDLRQIIEQSRSYLSPKGLLVVEHGYNQGQAVFDHFKKNGFVQINTLYDIEQRPRATLGFQQ